MPLLSPFFRLGLYKAAPSEAKFLKHSFVTYHPLPSSLAKYRTSIYSGFLNVPSLVGHRTPTTDSLSVCECLAYSPLFGLSSSFRTSKPQTHKLLHGASEDHVEPDEASPDPISTGEDQRGRLYSDGWVAPTISFARLGQICKVDQ